MEPLALARQLIDIPSTTDNEGDVGAFLFDELTRLGYACRKHAVSETRFNVYASAGGRPRVVLNSHIDTVPPWFASREDEEYLYGRGACDTKGVLAAMIAAGERLRAAHVNEFAFLFVVGEETDSIGAKTANVEFKDLGSEYLLVGEPTESTFARASKGALTAFVHFEGIAGHSAYPERGDSAIHKMAKAIVEINATSWGSHEILGNATVNVGAVRGGEKPNVIAAAGAGEAGGCHRETRRAYHALARQRAPVHARPGRRPLGRCCVQQRRAVALEPRQANALRPRLDPRRPRR